MPSAPGLALEIGAVSHATGKGRHTTVGVSLVPLDNAGGGFVADQAVEAHRGTSPAKAASKLAAFAVYPLANRTLAR